MSPTTAGLFSASFSIFDFSRQSDSRSACNCATGSWFLLASLISSFARNPSLKGLLFSYTILGFALTEAIALFALMMAFLILFA